MRADRRNDRRRTDTWELEPTPDQTFRLKGRGAFDFIRTLDRSFTLQSEGRVEDACNLRFDAVQRIISVIPDDEETILEWGDANSRAALELLQASSEDHFLAGDFEMAAAISETLLELDPEDHLGNVVLSAFCYVALGEYELFDEIAGDIADSSAEKQILKMWSVQRRAGAVPESELRVFRERFAACFEEFSGDVHTADDDYLAQLCGNSPSRAVLARQLWLKTEHLWSLFPDFIEELKRFAAKG